MLKHFAELLNKSRKPGDPEWDWLECYIRFVLLSLLCIEFFSHARKLGASRI